MDTATARSKYDALKAEATLLAGGLFDIPRRVVVLANLFRDSGGNHAFSQIAAHGALWAFGYFEVGGSLGRLIARRYFYNSDERAYRLDLLREFADGFRNVNRLVCIDTYTNYQFTQAYGHHSAAAECVPAPLLEALNRIHYARRRQQVLPAAERKYVFEQSFLCEQEITVAPGVAQAVAAFDCRVMKFLCLRPVVRFAYFPRFKYLVFRDFSSKEERIERGLQAYYYADRMGWPHVDASLRAYGRMSRQFFESPEASLAEIRAGLPQSVMALNEALSNQESPPPTVGL